MRRLLASGLLPKRAGQPVKGLVHMSFAELCELDTDSALQDKWIADYRARWAARRAAASVSTGDGGAGLEGDAARRIACDAMLIPVVTVGLDPGAIDELISICVRYHALRTQATQDDTATQGHPATPGTQPPRATQPPRTAPRLREPRAGRRTRWRSWSSRSWPRCCRWFPGRVGWRRSCGGTCWAGA